MQKKLQGLLMSLVTAGVLASAAGSAGAADHDGAWRLPGQNGNWSYSGSDGSGVIKIEVGLAGQVSKTSYVSGLWFQHRAQQQCWDASIKTAAWSPSGFNTTTTPTCSSNGNTGAGRGWFRF